MSCTHQRVELIGDDHVADWCKDCGAIRDVPSWGSPKNTPPGEWRIPSGVIPAAGTLCRCWQGGHPVAECPYTQREPSLPPKLSAGWCEPLANGLRHFFYRERLRYSLCGGVFLVEDMSLSPAHESTEEDCAVCSTRLERIVTGSEPVPPLLGTTG